MPDLRRARALLQETDWADADIESVGGGTVNSTFRLRRGAEMWYLRIGPTDLEAEAGPSWLSSLGLRREHQAIALWASHQHVLPETVHFDFSRDHIGSDWVIQKALPGNDWHAVRSRLSGQDNADLWRQLGVLIAELHAYIGPEFGTPEAGLGHATWSELVRWDATGLLTDAHKYGLPTQPFQDLCDLIDQSAGVLDAIREPRLIHSDLSPRHVMVQRTERGHVEITGLIDLEFARFADAASESVFVEHALSSTSEEHFDLFLESYGAPEPSADDKHRGEIYQLTALGWWVTDAVRLKRVDRAHTALEDMTRRLKDRFHLL